MEFVYTNLGFLKSVPASWSVVIFAFGCLVIVKDFTSFLRWIYVYFLRPCKDLRRTYGSWAIVTGCTDGIGRAMALELARKGMNLVLIGRNPAKLKAVSDEILAAAEYSSNNNACVKTLVFDLSGDLCEGIGRVGEAIEELDIGVLVNNAGLANLTGLFFHEGRIEFWREMLKVNVEALTMVTEVVLHGMRKRGRGAIVNIGSGSTVAVPSNPLFAIYTATKAYVEYFSRSLHVEYKKSGIDVQCQTPLYVLTNMTASYKTSSFFVPSAENYAKAAVRWIGYDVVCMPSLVHSLQCFGASKVPDFLLNMWRLDVGIRHSAPLKKHF